MTHAEKLAYFFDAADLRGVFRGWPEEVALVLCMDEGGGCEMLLFQRDERVEVISRVAEVLDRPLGQFAVVPPLAGHPTRRVLFSDEQKLIALVAAETDLPEKAADFLINHRFEKDRRARMSEASKAAAKARAVKGVRAAATKPEPANWRTRFSVSDIKPKPAAPKPAPKANALPGGYLSGAELRGEDCQFAEGVLSVGRRGIRLVVAPDKLNVRTPVIQVMTIGFRDDFSRFVLPREAAKGWQVGDPLVIDMPLDAFPAGLQQRFALSPRAAEVTFTRHGIFVVPGGAVAPLADPEADKPSRAPWRKRLAHRPLITPFRLALVALTGVGLMTGSVIRAVDMTGSQSAPSAYVARTDR